MARPKKEQYEYIPGRDLYRKRKKGADGIEVSITARCPEVLDEKVALFNREQAALRAEMENPLVNRYIDTWMDKAVGGISTETRASYMDHIRRYIKPYMEGRRMKEIYPYMIQELMSGLTNKCCCTYNVTYMLLKRVFTFAYENGDIEFNPCPVMHNGGKQLKEKDALTPNQTKALIDAVRGTSAYLFVMICLYSGLRKEEVYGLKWECVHLEDTPFIEVKRACRWLHNKPEVTDRLKSKAARRDVPIPKVLVDCLAEAKKTATSEYVFHHKNGGPFTESQDRSLWRNVTRRTVNQRTYYRYVKGKRIPHVVEAQKGEKAKRGGFTYCIDFKVTPHLLRHTYISNLLAKGVDIKTVQYLAGHEKSKTTLDIYAHLMYHRPEELMRQISGVFAPRQNQAS